MKLYITERIPQNFMGLNGEIWCNFPFEICWNFIWWTFMKLCISDFKTVNFQICNKILCAEHSRWCLGKCRQWYSCILSWNPPFPWIISTRALAKENSCLFIEIRPGNWEVSNFRLIFSGKSIKQWVEISTIYWWIESKDVRRIADGKTLDCGIASCALRRHVTAPGPATPRCGQYCRVTEENPKWISEWSMFSTCSYMS